MIKCYYKSENCSLLWAYTHINTNFIPSSYTHNPGWGEALETKYLILLLHNIIFLVKSRRVSFTTLAKLCACLIRLGWSATTGANVALSFVPICGGPSQFYHYGCKTILPHSIKCLISYSYLLFSVTSFSGTAHAQGSMFPVPQMPYTRNPRPQTQLLTRNTERHSSAVCKLGLSRSEPFNLFLRGAGGGSVGARRFGHCKKFAPLINTVDVFSAQNGYII